MVLILIYMLSYPHIYCCKPVGYKCHVGSSMCHVGRYQDMLASECCHVESLMSTECMTSGWLKSNKYLGGAGGQNHWIGLLFGPNG